MQPIPPTSTRWPSWRGCHEAGRDAPAAGEVGLPGCLNPEFPGVGEDNGAGPWLVKASEIGARFVLFTCRDGAAYAAAAEWCARYLGNLGLTWISGIDGPGKQHAQLYIDDKALGAPLKQGRNGRPCVDWGVAGPLMMQAIYRRQGPPLPDIGQEMVQALAARDQYMNDLRAAGNALAEGAYHEQRRGFTATCLPTCRVCAWNRLSP